MFRKLIAIIFTLFNFISCISEVDVELSSRGLEKKNEQSLESQRVELPFVAVSNAKAEANTLPTDNFNSVYRDESSNLYYATEFGLSIKYLSGDTISINTGNGLSTNKVNDVLVIGNKIILATGNGVSISSDSGITFKHISTSDGLTNVAIKR